MNKKQKRFIQWLLTPVEGRHPESQEELAKELNCRPSTLRRWFNTPAFKRAIDEEILYQIEVKKASTYQALIQKAMEGDFRSIQALIDMQGSTPTPENGKLDSEERDGPFTYEEYRQALKNIEEWERREFGEDASLKDGWDSD